MGDWTFTETTVSIRHASSPGCGATVLVILGAGAVVVAGLLSIGVIGVPEPVVQVAAAGFFGGLALLLFLGAVNVRRSAGETVVSISSVDHAVKISSANRSAPVVIPFAHLESVLLLERVEERTEYVSVHAKGNTIRPKTTRIHTYPVYLTKNDGAVVWLDTMTDRERVDQVKTLLEIAQISCDDRASGKLSRSIESKYPEPNRKADAPDRAPNVEIEDLGGGDRRIRLRAKRAGVVSVVSRALAVLLFVLLPIGLLAAFPDTFPPAIAAVPAFTVIAFLVGSFVSGRSYDLLCRAAEVEVAVRFAFGPFQRIFGKTARIPTSAINGVRVSRYDGGTFRLELAIDPSYDLSRAERLSFNSGNMRTVRPDEAVDDSQTLALWTVGPAAKNGTGPTFHDLYAAEAYVERIYGLGARKRRQLSSGEPGTR